MRTKIKLLIIVGTLFLISSCNQKSEEADMQEEKLRIPVMVDVINAQEYEIIVTGIGKIDSRQRATIIFESQGQLEKIHKNVGDEISKEDVIAEINSTIYKSAFQLAEASFKQTESDLEDARILLKKNAISNDEFNQLHLSFISTKSIYTQARERYDKCSLTAPFDGTIVDMNLNPGEYIAPSQTVLPPVILADMDHLIIEVSVSEKDISKIQVGQDVLVHVKAYDGAPFDGKVSLVGLMTSQGSSSFKIEISLMNIDRQLKLGMIANVSITVKRLIEALVIPRKYILEDSNGNFVFISENARAVKKRITIEDSRRDIIMITGDLKPGDSLITQGYRKISVDSPLKVIN